MQDANQQPNPVSFWESFIYWPKLGFISFGGPAGQISIMHQELVEKRRWISEHRFLHALNYTMVLPGSEAQQLATYICWLMHGVILNLATFFAYHILWPQGFDVSFEWLSTLIGVAAFVALFRYKIGIFSVIIASSLLGLAYLLVLE